MASVKITTNKHNKASCLSCLEPRIKIYIRQSKPAASQSLKLLKKSITRSNALIPDQELMAIKRSLSKFSNNANDDLFLKGHQMDKMN